MPCQDAGAKIEGMKGQVVIPLYKADQWPRWGELFEDTPTYEQWFKGHVEGIERFRKQGVIVHEIEIDIDLYVAWTKETKQQINADTRNEYPNHVLAERVIAMGGLDPT